MILGRSSGPSRGANSSGFTIAEVLVVLLIMSGLLVSMTQVLASARDTRDRIRNLNENQLAGPAILDLVEQDLRGLMTFSMRPSKMLRVEKHEIGGEAADRIDLVTSTNSKLFEIGECRAVRADFNEVGYCLRERPDDSTFRELYRREAFGVDEDPFTGGRYTFLHDRVVSFQVNVYDEDGPDAEPLEGWNTETEPQNKLPLRIEILLEVELSERLLDPKQLRDSGKRRIEYKRIYRFGDFQLTAFDIEPVPKVPNVFPPSEEGDGSTNDGLDLATDDLFNGSGGPGGNGQVDVQLDGNGANPFGGGNGNTNTDFGSFTDLLQGAAGGGGGG